MRIPGMFVDPPQSLRRFVVAALLLLPGVTLAHAELTFAVESASGTVGGPVSVPIAMTGSSAGNEPATILLFLEYDEALLDFVEVAIGPAVPGDKVLTIEPPNPAGGEVGFGIAGLAETVISDGVVLVVTFDIVGDGGGTTIPLTLSTDSSAASIEAAPLELSVVDGLISLGCLEIDIPDNVAATSGEPLGVTVTWDAVDGAAEYHVYRGETSDPAASVPLGDWQAGLQYFDATAEPPSPGSLGGCGPSELVPVPYFYFVKARTEPGCDSAFSAGAEGFRGEDAAATAAISVVLLLLGPSAWRFARGLRPSR